MRLYVKNSKGDKIYLTYKANSRIELSQLMRGMYFNFGTSETFSIDQVYAESDIDNNLTTVVGGVLGGVIGIIGGPLGVVLGGSLGGVIGNMQNSTENSNVNNFNNSVVSSSW